MALSDVLSVYLQRESIRPLVWGENDCCLFLANFIKELTGRDLAASFRGQYDDEEGALAFCNEVGGAAILISRGLRQGGFESVEVPSEGDFGCVDYADEIVGAIYFQDKWFLKSDDGICIVAPDGLRVLKVWNVSQAIA